MAERQHTEHTKRPKSREAHRAGPMTQPHGAEEAVRQPRKRLAGFTAGGELGVSAATTAGRANEGVSVVATATTLLGGREVIGSSIESDLDVHEMLRRGLPRAALGNLVENLLVIGVDEASEALGVSVRTLQRHKHAPVVHLNLEQSGRTWKFAEVLAKATRVLGSQEEAEQWLKRPAIGLDQRRPVDLLTTPAGVKLVEDYLGRIEYGVYT